MNRIYKTKQIIKIDPTDGFVVSILYSNKIAAELALSDNGTISEACNTNHIVKGYYYRYLDDMITTNSLGMQFIKGTLYGPIELATIGVKVWCLDTEIEVMMVKDLIIFNPYTGILETEMWKPITGYDSYFVSSFGRVKRKVHEYWRLLKHAFDDKGYTHLTVLNKSCKIHRLVASHFVSGFSEINSIVNHKNEVKHDNKYWNLEWCTHRYNCTYGSLSPENRKDSKAVNQYDLTTGELLGTFSSTREAGRQTGAHGGSISSNCLGKTRSAGGFRFEYVNK